MFVVYLSLVQDFLSGWFEVSLGFAQDSLVGFVLDLLRFRLWCILGWLVVFFEVSMFFGGWSDGRS